MKKIGVDPDCVELVRRWLTADPIAKPVSDAEAEANVQSLSEDIQRAIEDWFFAHDRPTDG